MYLISQRLSRLFSTLLESDKPLSVTQLADQLNVSRRTIFRELKDVDGLLSKYHLTLETSVGEGLYLSGTSENKMQFSTVVYSQESSPSIDKEERRIALALSLLSNFRWQKLLYYASLLDVSEATVSLDLDVIETELAEFQISVLRKKGLGILVCGQERQLRSATVEYLMKTNGIQGKSILMLGFPSLEVQEGVVTLLKDLSLFFDWMTVDAKELMGFRLMVQVSRLQQQMELPEENHHRESTLYLEMAHRVASELSSRFDIDVPTEEIYYLAGGLRAARTKGGIPDTQGDEASFMQMQGLAYRMIERFHPQLAPLLKNNEELIRGLTIHLWSAVVRIINNHKIRDPLDGQIQREYPEIYQNTQRAVDVLREELGHSIPEGEVACIATHFGAAMMQIGNHRLRRRLKVGIICMGGIGVSYMMKGQISKEFGNQLSIEIGEYNKPDQWAKHDFLIATTSLPHVTCPVIVANPVLTQQNYQDITTLIQQLMGEIQVTSTHSSPALLDHISEASRHLDDIKCLLNNFSTIPFSANQTVEELAKFAGYRFANSIEMGEQIFHDLMTREAMSSQIIQPLNLLLLHCVTTGVECPTIALLHMTNCSVITSDNLNVTSGLIILAPKDGSSALKEAIGAISGALVEHEEFLAAIHNGDSDTVYRTIQSILNIHLTGYFSNVFHN